LEFVLVLAAGPEKNELPELALLELLFEFAPPKKELVELELVPAELELLPPPNVSIHTMYRIKKREK